MIFPTVFWVVMSTSLAYGGAHQDVSETEIRFLGGLFNSILCGGIYRHMGAKFYLHRQEGMTIVSEADASDLSKFIDTDKEVVFLIHDFHDGCDKPFSTTTRKAWMEHYEDDQVISVCHSGADKLEISRIIYRGAVSCIADKIVKVLKSIDVPPKQVTLVGHGYGAQIAGKVGSSMKGEVGKIIALDPSSLLLFRGRLNEVTPDSAQDVIVLHTGIPHSLIGIKLDIGTMVFMANDGQHQPGCSEEDHNLLIPSAFSHTCSHRRAFEFFVESIENPSAFMARECENWKNYLLGLCEENEKVYFEKDVKSKKTHSKLFIFETEGSKPYSKNE